METLVRAVEAWPGSGNADGGGVALFTWGGAINDVPVTDTAFPHRNALFLVSMDTSWSTADGPATIRENLRWLDTLYAETGEFATSAAYANFADPDLADWRSAYYGPNLPRLEAVKRRYDPDRFFRYGQALEGETVNQPAAIRRSDPMTHQTAEAPVAGVSDTDTAAQYLARARALAPQLRARSAEIEASRRAAGRCGGAAAEHRRVPHGLQPSLGRPELSSAEQTEVIEAISYGDASARWCAMIGMDTGLYASFLDEADVKEMYPSLDMITAGLLFPVGKAEILPGGYRLSGRWQFGSGITHSDWVVSGAFLYRDGSPYPSKADHDSRLFLVPRSEVEIIDTWHTTGLAGQRQLRLRNLRCVRARRPEHRLRCGPQRLRSACPAGGSHAQHAGGGARRDPRGARLRA